MRIINLDQNFKPYGGLGELYIKKFMFPSGIEPHINVSGLDIKGDYEKQDITITHRIKTMNDIFEILLTIEALTKTYSDQIGKLNLFIPYLPFSRQDRICAEGDSFSLKIIGDLLNACIFDSIITLDVHSAKAFDYVNNLNSIPLERILPFNERNFSSNALIISPDVGSRQRCNNFAHELKEVIECSKIRNPETGVLSGFDCEIKDFKGKECIIVDDICSRGGTFIGIANMLKERNAGKITLVVSHYEGIADEAKLKEAGIEKVYKTNSMNDYESNFVENIKIKLIL